MACTRFRVQYRSEPVAALLARPGTLAVFGFTAAGPQPTDPRYLQVALPALDPAVPSECWTVTATVDHGSNGDLRWSRGGGWRFLALEVDEADSGGIERAARHAYDRLLTDAAASPEPHILRIWNYLDAINAGSGDAERYRLFCSGRAAAMATHRLTRYPAATAIGHHDPRGRLQVYALCAAHDGTAVENPRQVSAWNYPRQFGPSAPGFARAMRLPGGSLAISGTAAVTGYASRHEGDVAGQAREVVANLRALLERAELPPFDAASPLKIYVRDPDTADAVRTVFDAELGSTVPRLLLWGDVCRRELLVECDGWRFHPAG